MTRSSTTSGEVTPTEKESSPSPRESRDFYFGYTPSPITRIHRISNGRLNSRFFHTLPSMEFLQMARREGQLMPDKSSRSQDRLNVNSPVFYIRLPPAPYVLVPGLGYVSPHPYNTPIIGAPPNSVMMSPLGMMMNGMEDDHSESSENMAPKNVISLPLTFLSNGRPAQIKNHRKPPPSSKKKPFKPDPAKMTTLLGSGKYSFNGRPNGVFIVRSPIVDGSPNSI